MMNQFNYEKFRNFLKVLEKEEMRINGEEFKNYSIYDDSNLGESEPEPESSDEP